MYLDVDDYILQQEPSKRVVFERLRNLVLTSAPYIVEKIKYKIPFYEYRGSLCYLNMQKDSIYLGFTKGVHLSNEQQMLIGNGKTVRKLFVTNTTPSDESILEVIQEAIMLNEVWSKNK